MKVNVKYFGMIAENINCSSEELEIEFEGKMNLRTFFEGRYASIKGMNYKIAINQELNDFLENTSDAIEIALLPPFAGG